MKAHSYILWKYHDDILMEIMKKDYL